MYKRPQAFLGFLQIADLALPQFKDIPAQILEGRTVAVVSGPVRFDLR